MAASKPYIKVEIISTKGSTPRDAGAAMYVNHHEVIGSIGGGRLEADAVAHARAVLSASQPVDNPVDKPLDKMVITLGTKLGQCCGGVVEIEFAQAILPNSQIPNLAIFGAGHVGAKLAQLAKVIPFHVALYDSRPQIEIADPEPYHWIKNPEIRINDLSPQTYVVILTHDHALDFRLAERALLRDDLGFIGMIGSQSKAAQFRSQFQALGARLDRLNSPIGKHASRKEPSSVALAVLLAVTHYQNTHSQTKTSHP